MMHLLEIGISNAIAATCVALIVASITRFCRQPPLVFCLWLLGQGGPVELMPPDTLSLEQHRAVGAGLHLTVAKGQSAL